MVIYIDKDYKCHVSDDGTRRLFDVPEFDGMCSRYIEGYRYVPSGESWEREDGESFEGEMLAPCKPYGELAAAQAQYEADLIVQQDMENALAILLGGDVT